MATKGDDCMIDTDKYEGHSPAPWSYTLETEDKIWDEHGAVWDKNKNCLALVDDGSEQSPDADLRLIADAPLLLAEIKRLRAWKKLVSDIVQQHDGSHLREMLKEMIE
jgi:hypothetical protein